MVERPSDRHDSAAIAGDPDELPRRLARIESERAALAERLRAASRSLLEANQGLARIPVLEQRLEEARGESQWLREELAAARARSEELESPGD